MPRAEGAVAVPLFHLTPTARRSASGVTNGAALALGLSSVAAFLGSIALATVGEASGLSVLAERPLAAIQTAAGLSLITVMVAIPALRGVGRLWVRREVRLFGDAVEIARHTPMGIRRETVPLATYRGIAHCVRASLSGLVHEIVLVHSNSDHNVTLMATESVSEALLEECKVLFGLPEIPSSAIMQRGAPG